MFSNFLLNLAFQSRAFAADCPEGSGSSLPDPSCIFGTEGGQNINAQAGKDAAQLISSILDPVLLIAGGLAVVALIYSGIMYFTAYGDEAKAKLAKRNSTWAIIGIVIIVLSYTLVAFISQASFLGF